MSSRARGQIGRYIFILIFALIFITYFLDIPALVPARKELDIWVPAITATAIGVGLLNQMRVYVDGVRKHTKDYLYGIWAAVCIVFMLVLGQGLGIGSPQYKYFFTNVYFSLRTTFGRVLTFYTFSAAFRSVRLKTKESTVLMIAFVFSLLAGAPVGPWLWSGFSDIAGWILNVVLASGMRAIVIGAAVGLFSLALRVMWGREKASIEVSAEV
jgi:hypothetical protein